MIIGLLLAVIACVAAFVGISFLFAPFLGLPWEDAGAKPRSVATADPVCIEAWNATGPKQFLSGYESTAIVERLDGHCLISTGLDGYVLRGRWVKIQYAPRNWHNVRHGTDGVIRPYDPAKG